LEKRRNSLGAKRICFVAVVALLFCACQHRARPLWTPIHKASGFQDDGDKQTLITALSQQIDYFAKQEEKAANVDPTGALGEVGVTGTPVSMKQVRESYELL